ncbi:MMPL family transporter [uncultured Sphaerochaeta sp.]|uniref:efflux RND transporter permease subunit n=1 Tax=uncultured Sphaerochaeta sp. TaxID=886478 RepID=UPI002A0A18C6|nr:MMPL family transporter [uncultured Sphaerochaeta sp.]
MGHSSRKPWIVIAVVLLATGVMGFMIPRILIDNDIKNYVPHNLPSYALLEKSDAIYGSQILMDIAIDTTNTTILTPEAIDLIKKLTTEIENLPDVDSVQSLTNVDFIAGIDGGMSVGPLVPDDFAGTDEELRTLRKDIVDWQQMYDKIIMSSDLRGSQIIVTISKDITPEEMDQLYQETTKIISDNSIPDLTIRLAGDPVLSQKAKEYMNTDLVGLIPLVSLVVLLCLLFSFRNLEGMLLPFITVIVSTVWTVGLMALTGAHFTVVSSCLPVVLIAVGSAYGIHVMNHYYEALRKESTTLTFQRHRELVLTSMKKVRVPVILAGITTIGGFISTITSPIQPLKTFAIFSAIGVTIALGLSLFFIPSLLLVKPLGKVNRDITKHNKPVDKDDSSTLFARNRWHETAVGSLYSYLTERKGRIVILFILILMISFWGISRLNVESSIINYFPESSPIRTDAKFIDDNFSGTNSFSFIIQGQNPGDLTNPEILKDMDDLSTYLSNKYPQIGKVVSFSDFIKRMNKVMHSETASGELDSQDIEDDQSSTVDSFFGSEESAATVDTSGTDSFFSEETQETTSTKKDTFVASSMDLESPTSIQQVMDLFDRSFAEAGGGKVTVDQFLDAMKKELNYNGAAYDEIPYDLEKYPVNDRQELKNLIAQYLLLYSGSLDQFSDNAMQPSQARMQIQLTTHKTKVVDDIIKDAENYANLHFPHGYTLKAYGFAELENSLTSMITQSQLTSLLLAILAVFLILTLYFKSPVAGIIGAIPLILSILINFGIMGLAGINLDMVTSLIGSIAIGIGVDYTIHFMSDYHYERLLCDDLNTVTLNTLATTGKAIVVNAVSVGLGFLVLCLSRFVVLRYIGLLVAVVMLTSSVTAMTILPAMLNVFKPKFISRPIRTKLNRKKSK